MTETAGLVVGVFALAGLFNNCLEMMSHISALRSMHHDAELLNTKLDVEKTLFLQWADRVRLLHSDCDVRLRSGDTAQTIEKVLKAMSELASDSSEIQARYGLRQRLPEDSILPGEPENPISGPRMLNFNKALEKLQIRTTTKQKSRSSSRLSKVRWVVIDKAKFDCLIKDISYFIAKLNELIPPVAQLLSTMAYQDLNRSDLDKGSLNLVIDFDPHHTPSPEEDLLTAAKVIRSQNLVLDTLWFRQIDDRREIITSAHSQTLKWALEPPLPDQSWSDLSLWLRSGSGVYWISGKAGSGKSTLMKYLVHHPTTDALLQIWADGTELISPHFFFYYLGTKDQKSFTGLTRTLLHHILTHNKAWIPTILPGMWKESINHHGARAIDLPTLSELKNAFTALVQLPIKLCVFIDGLDEYEGEHQDTISFIESLSSNPNVKLLVSSRPEPEFVDSLSLHPMLRMQELTRKDISLYVTDKIESHRYMSRLLHRDDTSLRARQILDDLCDKAEGVFIWSVLACKSLE
ncbi:prion-inhibition and propagation-domain-containing protein [Apiosordaria backusii]|uniref:Prion-inhibition and propagation-domain-containing protein n=1 Tax=Apiosordaria backusii TaxID=314023 RepID=A0AA40E3B5_9PEZI|nr:prion-inhibition and propagation-domain-containing protein [Apiosordaria backusii]